MGDTDVEAQVRTLDSVVDSLGLDRLDLLKIDVEGFETDVLSGGSKALAEFRPVAQIEFNSWVLTTHRRQLPQEALEDILAVFPFVYVLERHGARFGRVLSDSDRLSLLRANMLHGCVDNLLCGFDELVPDAPPFAAVWEEFTLPKAVRVTEVGPVDRTAELAQAAQLAELAKELAQMKQHSARLEQEHAATLDTISWRVTRPLRTVRSLSRRG